MTDMFSDKGYEKVFSRGRGRFKVYMIAQGLRVIILSFAVMLIASVWSLTIRFYLYGTMSLLSTLSLLIIVLFIPCIMFLGFDLKYALDYWRMKTQ
jgi:hypothetical protein